MSMAEGYHHNYFAENPDQAYCAVVIAPKTEIFLADNMGRCALFYNRKYKSIYARQKRIVQNALGASER